MNTKSLSPRAKPSIKKPKILLKKITSLQKLKSQKNNESMPVIRSPDSNITSSRSQLASVLHSSSPRITLTKSGVSSAPSFKTQNKLKEIVKKFSSQKALKSLEKPGEHLLPMSSKDVLLKFEVFLTKFELKEIKEYPIIYYLGLRAKKAAIKDKIKNSSFDDSQTDYILTAGDQLGYQFEVLELLGCGSFSQVCKCFDHKSKKEVAVKIIKSHKRFEDQAKIELKILSYIKKHDESGSFSQILASFKFRGHLCLVFELLSFNLYSLLKANGFQGFSVPLVRRFVSQVLVGLTFLSQHKIIHCDLKPENLVLVNSKESSIKIIDLGSSCFETEKIYYYIQSRVYRSPEVILGIPYSTAIDMWSLGCIIAELLTGKPLFVGENEADQLGAIIEVLGYPPNGFIDSSKKKSKFFDFNNTLKYQINSRGKIRVPKSRNLKQILSTNDANLLDFIEGCFEWMPDKRLTPECALAHPWLQTMKKVRLIKVKKIKSNMKANK